MAKGKRRSKRAQAIDDKPLGSAPGAAGSQYAMDPARTREYGRSPELLALDRRCSRCWASLSQEENVVAAYTFEEHRDRIVECCSQRPEYIMPGMPLMEAMFRLLLASGRPVGMEEVQEALAERWISPSLPRELTAEMIQRVAEADRYYGIVKVTAKEGAPAAA